jgi:predicted nucleic acid-binding protein
MIVVDVNVLAYLWIPGELTDLAEQALARDAQWATSILWRSEFRNILAGYLRRGSIGPAAARCCLEGAESQLSGCEYVLSPDWPVPCGNSRAPGKGALAAKTNPQPRLSS